MLTTKIGDFETSRIALGAWAIGGGSWWGDNDDKESIEAVRASVDGGVTLIDTAPAYGFGHSEVVLGKALVGIRDKVRISTKAGLVWDTDEGAWFFEKEGYTMRRNLSKKSIMKEAEDSLKRMNTDRIDIYFTHWPCLPEFPTPVGETMEALLKLKEQGKILAIGVSNTSPENLGEYFKYGKVDLIQEKSSILSRSSMDALGEITKANDIVFQPYSPLESGLLTGKLGRDYVAQEGSARAINAWFEPKRFAAALDMLDLWQPLCEKYDATTGQLAIAWMAALGDRMSVLCGARTVEQALSNVKSAQIELSDEDIGLMSKTAEDVIAECGAV